MDSALNPFFDVGTTDAIDGGGAGTMLFSWESAARDGGYEGDVSGLRRRDEEAARNSMQHVAGGGGRSRGQDAGDLPNASTTYARAMKAWTDERRIALGIIPSIVRQIFALGYTNAKRGLVTGQYHKPTGLSYGGGAHNSNKLENSILAVQHAIFELAGFRFDRDSNDRTVWVDVHTGLGGYGRYSVLTKNNDERGGDDDERSDAWTSEFTSLLERAGMGYGRSGDDGKDVSPEASGRSSRPSRGHGLRLLPSASSSSSSWFSCPST